MFALLACTGPSEEDTAVAALGDASAIVYGAAGDMAGSAVAAGDLDADGVDDLVVAGLGAREACVLRGPVSGAWTLDDTICLGQAEPYDFAGYAVAVGAGALLVGAPGSDHAGESAGSAWLITAVPEADTTVDVGTPYYGEFAGDAFGSTVALDDGVVIVGAPGSDLGGPSGGAVYVYGDGAASVYAGGGGAGGTAKHAGSILGDGVGNAVCAPADLDGDGVSDLVITAPGWDAGAENAGAVAIFYGPLVDGTWGVADGTVFAADRAEGYAGGAVACGGDTDGDGVGELLYGADGDDGGRVYLRRGADTVLFVGDDAEQAGYSVAFVGTGVAVGSPSADGSAVDAGAVTLVAGPFSGTVSLTDGRRWAGEGAGDLAGAALAATSDGLLVGAPYCAAGAPVGGAAYVIVP